MLLLYPSSQLDPRAPDEIYAEEYAAAASLGLRVAKQQGAKDALMLKPKGLASSSPGLALRLARVGDVYSHTPTGFVSFGASRRPRAMKPLWLD